MHENMRGRAAILEEVVWGPCFTTVSFFASNSGRLVGSLLLETIGSPARGHGSNCKLGGGKECQQIGYSSQSSEDGDTHKVYFRCSSISMMAAWLPHL